ncbi:MAG: mechanosensitive ion channel family protein [Comamonas sp.]|nr:mechanosensitive ion channel family protein [Comamonas sp.]
MYQELQPWAKMAVELVALALVAVLAGLVARLLLLRAMRAWRLALPQGWAQVLLHDDVLLRLARAVPSVVVQLGTHALQQTPSVVLQGLNNLAAAFTIYHVVRAIHALLTQINIAHDAANGTLTTPTRSIKSYVQLGKLLAWVVGLLLMVATVLDRSPLLLLSGLGAMSAVLMLVFKDTILSFVAGVQLASNDMLRVGDWIEMPKENADGAVVEINLNTVKVQNWDKTITSIPTWKLMSESFKNWRGMSESGGRRILRALPIDAATVEFLTPQRRAVLEQLPLLQKFFQAASGPCTNLAALRAYAQAYLENHPQISKAPGMTLMVRVQEPTALGIPLQLYCFSAVTAWVDYEGIQGQVVDHLIGMLPQFGLALYQRSSDLGSRIDVKTDNPAP